MGSNASSSKLLKKNMSQFLGSFLDPDSAQKMRETVKQWSNVKIYENIFIFPNECEAQVFRNLNTGEILWETIKFTNLRKPIPQQEELVSHLRRNDAAKWNDVFVWLSNNRSNLIGNKCQNASFVKELMLTIAKNIDVAFGAMQTRSPLRVAAEFDDTDSILTLLERGANVHQNVLHFAVANNLSKRGNINACATLLENNANIDAVGPFGWTPLMFAARHGNKKAFEFLVERGADKNRIDNNGRTASQIARMRYPFLFFYGIDLVTLFKHLLVMKIIHYFICLIVAEY